MTAPSRFARSEHLAHFRLGLAGAASDARDDRPRFYEKINRFYSLDCAQGIPPVPVLPRSELQRWSERVGKFEGCAECRVLVFVRTPSGRGIWRFSWRGRLDRSFFTGYWQPVFPIDLSYSPCFTPGVRLLVPSTSRGRAAAPRDLATQNPLVASDGQGPRATSPGLLLYGLAARLPKRPFPVLEIADTARLWDLHDDPTFHLAARVRIKVRENKGK